MGESGGELTPASPSALAAQAAKRIRGRPFLWTGFAAAVAVCVAIAGWLFLPRQAHALRPTDTIVLADFANSTGDVVFDDTLKQALASELEQSPYLNIVSERSSQHAAADGPHSRPAVTGDAPANSASAWAARRCWPVRSRAWATNT